MLSVKFVPLDGPDHHQIFLSHFLNHHCYSQEILLKQLFQKIKIFFSVNKSLFSRSTKKIIFKIGLTTTQRGGYIFGQIEKFQFSLLTVFIYSCIQLPHYGVESFLIIGWENLV